MTPEPQPHLIIYQSEIDTLRRKAELLRDLYPASAEAIEKMCARIENHASHSSGTGAEQVLVQCETCLLKGTRACMYHGYPDTVIPKSCRYKVGVDADEALKNLEGTFIIKNLRAQRGREQE